MTINVHPDPQEAAGGYAFLELPGGTLKGETASVAVFDAYGERWLAAAEAPGSRIGVGNPHWQTERFEFGPYTVYRHEGADWVHIGPEIVNKVEEYAPLRLSIGGKDYPVTWPDDVPPRAGAAVLGGIQVVARPPAEAASPRLVGRVEPDVVADTVVPAPPSRPTPAKAAEPQPEKVRLEPKRSGFLVPLLLVLLLLVVAGVAAWWFWPEDVPQEVAAVSAPAPESVPKPAAVSPAPAPAPAGAPCSLEELGALADFASADSALRACGKDVSPDTALQVIEAHAAKGEGEALFLIGTLYDGDILDARMETLIGLTFEPDIARAVEYYSRAAKAGSAKAPTVLTATCARLKEADATLARGAYDDFCG